MGVGNNALKYQRIDVAEREKRRQAWVAPVPAAGLDHLLIAAFVIRRSPPIADASAVRARDDQPVLKSCSTYTCRLLYAIPGP